MKNIIGCIGFSILAINLSAQAPLALSSKQDSALYCFTMKDGLPVLMSGGKQVYNDITLQNGTQISINGTVIRKNGVQILLKTDECVDVNGDLSSPTGRSANVERSGRK